MRSSISWLAFAACVACIDAPLDGVEPAARLVITWDPRLCSDSHRVVVEVSGGDEVDRMSQVPCELGGVAIDLPRFGVYRGRIYAQSASAAIRSSSPLEIIVDQPIVHRAVATPR